MSSDFNFAQNKMTGFSLVELMVGMTIGFIAMIVIMQALSVFEGYKRSTTTGADAQENGLLALMAIESDIRRSSSGFNLPELFACKKMFSHYQEKSGTGAPIPVGAFSPMAVVIEDGGAGNDSISVFNAANFTAIAATQLDEDLRVDGAALSANVRRVFDLKSDVPPLTPLDPAADLLVVVGGAPEFNCTLFQLSSVTGNKITFVNGPAEKKNEYNASHAYMTANNWPGFGTRAGSGYLQGSIVLRIGTTKGGSMRGVTYSLNANNSLRAMVSSGAVSQAAEEIVASEVVALQAQYGVSASKSAKSINAWVDASGPLWGKAALAPDPLTGQYSAAAIDNRQRIKAIRIALVARSSQRAPTEVTAACTANRVTNYGPCAWEDDSVASPAPPIDLRAGAGDTEWQHYRYKVFQTIIPMRNVLWPDL